MDGCENDFNTQSDDDMESASDDDESCSSDDEVVSGDDDEEDGEEDESDEEEEVIEEFDVNENAGNMAAGSSDGDCPICLNAFVGQDIGVPESCEHAFCFECIREWSKNINTCPIDRTEFNYIRLRATPGGKDIKKVKVKVKPKEAEDAMQENVTLCEVCHSGDREDRLLLCDGCDLGYHCECLDPPLFYIPIEEWFCPPCSGVFRNGAVAGPSRSTTRRVIPRTRASEAVRSRLQNIRTRTTPTPRARTASVPRSTSSCSRKSATPVKKRKRRTYRRSIKKVVRLARTKQSMSNAGKGKVGARGTTIVVTYKRRRRRRKRRVGTKKSASRTSASPRPGSSTQIRIAKRLGISKSEEGSSIPEIKKSAWGKGSRLGSGGTAKLTTHSITGNKDQLMDFSENFNEDITNTPSCSSSTSMNRRTSEVSQPSTSINLLDSILAGQTLLHSKSDNIVIKTDGSLILKNEKTNVKKTNVPKKPESSNSSRPPMSVALAKEGVKSLTLSSNKISPKNYFEKKTRISHSKSSEHLPSAATTSETKSLNNKQDSMSDSTNKRPIIIRPKYGAAVFDSERYAKSTLPTWKIPKKNTSESVKHVSTAENVDDFDTLTSDFGEDVPSDWEAELSPVKAHTSNVVVKTEKEDFVSAKNILLSRLSSSYPSIRSNFSSDTSGSSSIKEPQRSVSTHFNKDTLSDDETNSNPPPENMQRIHIKQEVLSNEDINMNFGEQNKDGIKEQKSGEKHLNLTIKEEPKDPGSDTDASDYCNLASENVHDTPGSENSDYDESQSIIDSVSNISTVLTQHDKQKSKTPQLKIKEEIPSDDEEYSQSLVSSNSSALPISHSLFLEKSCQLKSKNQHLSSEISSKKLSHENLPSTQLVYNSVENSRILPACVSNRESNVLSCNGELSDINSDDELPPTQLNSEFHTPVSKRDVLSRNTKISESDKDLVPSKSFASAQYNNISKASMKESFNKNTLKRPSKSLSDEELSDLPATQVLSLSHDNLLEQNSDDELPPTQLNTEFQKPFPPENLFDKNKSRSKIHSISNKN